MLDKKIDVLCKVANVFNKKNITWNLGASCMLYLRGITETFNDIDIIVSKEDVASVKELFIDYHLDEREPNSMYKTHTFLEYIIDDVEIDIMSGFTIVSENKDYYFPLKKGTLSESVVIKGEVIYLETIEKWLEYYTLMNRTNKVDLLRKYLANN